MILSLVFSCLVLSLFSFLLFLFIPSNLLTPFPLCLLLFLLSCSSYLLSPLVFCLFSSFLLSLPHLVHFSSSLSFFPLIFFPSPLLLLFPLSFPARAFAFLSSFCKTCPVKIMCGMAAKFLTNPKILQKPFCFLSSLPFLFSTFPFAFLIFHLSFFFCCLVSSLLPSLVSLQLKLCHAFATLSKISSSSQEIFCKDHALLITTQEPILCNFSCFLTQQQA